MKTDQMSLEELIRKIPAESQRELRRFVLFLLDKQVKKAGDKLRQDWAGSLRDLRGQYTALELQKKALEWRGD